MEVLVEIKESGNSHSRKTEEQPGVKQEKQEKTPKKHPSEINSGGGKPE